MRIKITEEAQNDFKDMFAYYYEETQDVEYTRQIIQDIRGKIDHLKIFPFRCPALIPEDESIRALYYKRYAILYEVLEEEVIILNIKHTKKGQI